MAARGRRTVALAILPLIWACAGAGTPEALDALPTRDVLALSLPGGGTPGAATSALVGAPSELHRLATEVADRAQASLDGIALVLEALQAAPPSETLPDRTVWRQDDQVLVAQRNGDGYYEFTAARRDDDDGWKVILAGSTTLAVEGGRAQGAIWVDLSAAYGDGTGKVLALWSREGATRTLTVEFFHAATDKKTQVARDGTMHYQVADGTGTFVFVADPSDQAGLPGEDGQDPSDDRGDGKADAAEAKEPKPPEDVSIPDGGDMILRWVPGDSGRADLMGRVLPASGGWDRATWSQCWADPTFTTAWEALAVSGQNRPTVTVRSEGRLAACPYAEPGIPVLPPGGTEPEPPALPPEAQ